MPVPSVELACSREAVGPVEFGFRCGFVGGAWFSFCAGAMIGTAAAGFGVGTTFALASSARFAQGLTVGGRASCNTIALGSSFGVLAPFLPFFSGFAVPSLPFDPFCRSLRSAIHAGSDAWDFVSQVMSEDDPVGAEGESSLVAVDAVEEPVISGEDNPETPLRTFSSAFARSTALSFDSAGLPSCSSVLGCSVAFGPSLSSTSSAQFPPLEVSSDIEFAGVAAPDVTLLDDVCDAEAAVPLAACAYEKPLGLKLLPTAIVMLPEGLLGGSVRCSTPDRTLSLSVFAHLGLPPVPPVARDLLGTPNARVVCP